MKMKMNMMMKMMMNMMKNNMTMETKLHMKMKMNMTTSRPVRPVGAPYNVKGYAVAMGGPRFSDVVVLSVL